VIHEVKSISADITGVDTGGFEAIASTPSLDRDGEVLAGHCFAPLPKTIPVHLDHQLNAANVIARATPHYRGNDLLISAAFSASREAQAVRAKVVEGTLDSISVVFRGLEWQTITGVRTLIHGELLSADLVSIPSQRDARVLSTRGYSIPSRHGLRAEVDRALVEAELALAEVDLDEADRVLRGVGLRSGARNSQTDAQRLQSIHDMAVANGASCGGC
jgi:hypothetical protein